MRAWIVAASIACALSCKSQSVDVLAAHDASTLAVPKTTFTVGASSPDDGLPVVISRTSLIVDDDVLLTLPSREEAARTGVGAQYKEAALGRMILPLKTVACAASVRRRDAGLANEAIIIGDQGTPYRVITEVLFTLGFCEYEKFHLMVLQRAEGPDSGAKSKAARDAGAAIASPFALKGEVAPTKRPLALAVTITSDGVSFKDSAGPLGDGCDPSGSGVTVPSRDGVIDERGVRACAKRLWAIANGDDGVLISGQGATPYESVIDVYDAVRQDDAGSPMFVTLSFGVVH